MKILCFILVIVLVHIAAAEDPTEQKKQRADDEACISGGEGCQSDKKNGTSSLSAASKISTGIAEKAANLAKAALASEDPAAKMASHEVESQLADRAEEAAEAAHAILLGKMEVMEELKQKQKDMEDIRSQEEQDLADIHGFADAAAKSAAEAKAVVDILKRTLEITRDDVANSENVARGARNEMNEQKNNFETAHARTVQIEEELRAAEKDVKTTRERCKEAHSSASSAKDTARNAKIRMKKLTQNYDGSIRLN